MITSTKTFKGFSLAAMLFGAISTTYCTKDEGAPTIDFTIQELRKAKDVIYTATTTTGMVPRGLFAPTQVVECTTSEGQTSCKVFERSFLGLFGKLCFVGMADDPKKVDANLRTVAHFWEGYEEARSCDRSGF